MQPLGRAAVASANWPWPPLFKVAVVSSGVVLALFVVASMLLSLPVVRRHIVAGITRVLNAGSATRGRQGREDHRLLETAATILRSMAPQLRQ
jgi:hypothetical protein